MHITEMPFYFFLKSIFMQCSSSSCGYKSRFFTSVLIYLICSSVSSPPLRYYSCSCDPYGKLFQGTDLDEKLHVVIFFLNYFSTRLVNVLT